jgi:amino acid permease
VTFVINETTARERIAGLLATTRYFPRANAKTDKHGMPIIAPEPDDPDDERSA